jgi:acyl-CoA dehydrogenase
MWAIAFLAMIGVLSYHRASLSIWGLSLTLFLIFLTRFSALSWSILSIDWILFLGIYTSLIVPSLRKRLITKPILKLYRRLMPTMSRTEREALSAGTVGWEGDLFSGAPDWEKLLSLPKPALSKEEQAFLDGPVEELCSMIDDWDIVHNRADLPKAMWEFLKREGFFALIIPKKFGGKEFSAYAHSQILVKVYTRSATVGSTIAVPNSLGPAELLLKYGTEEQKNYYLPRLASGEEVPCFALTGPEAGSDAGAMPDKGIVCWQEFQGKKTLGILLNFNKRYITLAPVATVVGLAFKLYDPDHLLGQINDLGITCALIPAHTPGVSIGRRHFPANIVFQNGPIHGKNVFIPVEWIIGGPKKAGDGWRMLMECLAAGRAISLPSSSVGAAKALVLATGAYAHIRRQFNISIGRFEGIEEVLARMTARAYMMEATRLFTVSRIDQGEHAAVASGIAKYHVTEMGRSIVSDAMDVHGGKGICMGPKNYLAYFYQSMPIAITVEGANILTRNMIIFGQGVMRCHPYVFAEYEAAKMNDETASLKAFDKSLMGHIGFSLSNLIRSFLLGFTSSRIVVAPKRYFQHATRFSSAFALLADVALLTFGGNLKRKESISARLGDILSYLYMISAVLKNYHDQGEPLDDLPIVQWVCQSSFYLIQQRMDEVLRNFPNRFLAGILGFIIFPLGQHFSFPQDKLGFQVAELIQAPSAAVDRLTAGCYLEPVANNMLAMLADALKKVIAAEPVLKILKDATHNNLIEKGTLIEEAQEAYKKQLISNEQLQLMIDAEAMRAKVIAVDDFTTEELARVPHEVKKSEDHVRVMKSL